MRFTAVLAAASPPPPLPHPSARAFLRVHSALLCGVGLVFIVPFSRSALLGLLLCPVAHAAAACVLVDVVRREKEAAAGAVCAPCPASAAPVSLCAPSAASSSAVCVLDDGFVHVESAALVDPAGAHRVEL